MIDSGPPARRSHKAAMAALFGYLQYGLGMLTGLVLVPLTLHRVGARPWGVWLASNDILSYAAMVELGTLGVLPWLLGEAAGRRDRAQMRRLVCDGSIIGALVAIVYIGATLFFWIFLPSKLFLQEGDRDLLGGPLMILVAATFLTYPLRAFRSVLAGIQDVTFQGALGIVQIAIGAAITWVMLIKGYGLYALAWAIAVPTVILSVASFLRILAIAPDLVFGWTWPRYQDVRLLLVNGAGASAATFGAVVGGTPSVIITYLGHPEWAPIYSCSSKLTFLCMQLVWVIPDSALMGIAQVFGEARDREGLGRLVILLVQVHLILSGCAACGLLAFNPAFVSAWVGPQFFGGVLLNALLAFTIVLFSFAHGIGASITVLGQRVRGGFIGLAGGVVQLGCSVFLGHRFGLLGVAFAPVISTAVTVAPLLALLKIATGVTPFRLAVDVLGPWALRAGPFVIVAAGAGAFTRVLGLGGATLAALLLCCGYLWHLRPIYPALPLDPQWTRWLIRLRLLPPHVYDAPAADRT